AIAKDSSFAPAYAGLADAYSLTAPFGGRPAPGRLELARAGGNSARALAPPRAAPCGGGRPRDVFELARSAANRALALDSTVAEAHTSLGIVAMFYDWDWPAAGQHLARAGALRPSSA